MEVYSAMVMRVKNRMDAGEDVPDCLIKTLLLTQEREKLDWEDLCFMANAFNLGGVHSVSIIYIYCLPGCRLIKELLFIDSESYPVVPSYYLVTPRNSGPSPCGT
jgi:hypothetical protein